MGKFNIIGFGLNHSTIPPNKYRHCIVHPGSRLISKLDEPGTLYCPQCGTSYLPKDVSTEENFDPSVSPTNQTKIVQAKKKKKHYDSFGSLIPEDDLDIQKDIANGKTIISYNEQKSGKERHIVRKFRRL